MLEASGSIPLPLLAGLRPCADGAKRSPARHALATERAAAITQWIPRVYFIGNRLVAPLRRERALRVLRRVVSLLLDMERVEICPSRGPESSPHQLGCRLPLDSVQARIAEI